MYDGIHCKAHLDFVVGCGAGAGARTSAGFGDGGEAVDNSDHDQLDSFPYKAFVDCFLFDYPEILSG